MCNVRLHGADVRIFSSFRFPMTAIDKAETS